VRSLASITRKTTRCSQSPKPSRLVFFSAELVLNSLKLRFVAYYSQKSQISGCYWRNHRPADFKDVQRHRSARRRVDLGLPTWYCSTGGTRLQVQSGLQISLEIRLRSEVRAKFFSLKIAKRSENIFRLCEAKRTIFTNCEKLRKNCEKLQNCEKKF
jgi:hypothetical protein